MVEAVLVVTVANERVAHAHPGGRAPVYDGETVVKLAVEHLEPLLAGIGVALRAMGLL